MSNNRNPLPAALVAIIVFGLCLVIVTRSLHVINQAYTSAPVQAWIR